MISFSRFNNLPQGGRGRGAFSIIVLFAHPHLRVNNKNICETSSKNKLVLLKESSCLTMLRTLRPRIQPLLRMACS